MYDIYRMTFCKIPVSTVLTFSLSYLLWAAHMKKICEMNQGSLVLVLWSSFQIHCAISLHLLWNSCISSCSWNLTLKPWCMNHQIKYTLLLHFVLSTLDIIIGTPLAPAGHILEEANQWANAKFTWIPNIANQATALRQKMQMMTMIRQASSWSFSFKQTNILYKEVQMQLAVMRAKAATNTGCQMPSKIKVTY